MLSHILSKAVRHSDEGEHDTDKWLRHKCQVLISTYSSKPVYTRYGGEESIVGFTGTLQAVQSKFSSLFSTIPSDDEDSLRCISHGDSHIVYLDRSPLILVGICKSSESQGSYKSISRLLKAVYSQLLFVLTEGVNRTLEDRPNFDVRSLLGGTKPLFSNLISWMNNSMIRCVRDCAVEVLPLGSGARAAITRSLQQSIPPCAQWVGILAGHHLVAVAGPPESARVLSASDLILLTNLVVSSASLRIGESWTPVCLPSLSADAFVHCYVQYIDEDISYVCVCFSGENSDFYSISAHCKSFIELIGFGPEIDAINQALANIDKPFSELSEGGQQLLLHVDHCAIVLNGSRQLFSTRSDKSIVRRYMQCMGLLDDTINSSSQQVSLKTKKNFVFVWLTSEFQFFLTAPKDIDLSVITHAYQWIRQNEVNLFIPNLLSSGDSGTRINTRTSSLW
jgi:vacuolar fusion protein MON1